MCSEGKRSANHVGDATGPDGENGRTTRRRGAYGPLDAVLVKGVAPAVLDVSMRGTALFATRTSAANAAALLVAADW